MTRLSRDAAAAPPPAATLHFTHELIVFSPAGPCEGLVKARPGRRGARLTCVAVARGMRLRGDAGGPYIWGHDFYLVRGACWSVI